MCNPTALGWAAFAVGVAGIAAQDRAQARARRAAAQQQARNEELARRAAKDAQARGIIEESRSRQGSSYRLAQIRARLSAQGLDLGEGGAFDLLTGEASVAEEEALTIRTNARREALAIRQAAAAGSTEWRMMDARFSAARISSLSEAASLGIDFARSYPRAPSTGLNTPGPGADLIGPPA